MHAILSLRSFATGRNGSLNPVGISRRWVYHTVQKFNRPHSVGPISVQFHKNARMIFNIFKRRDRSPIPQQLYGGLVAQARNPVFFTHYGFADTVTGRFDCLAMHMFLFSRRIKFEKAENAAELGQDVFDRFVDNLDQALRELGIGDQSVPKRKKKLVHTFYGQIEDFDPPLTAGDREALQEAVARRFFEPDKGADNLSAAEVGATEASKHAALTADYMFIAAAALGSVPLVEIMSGRLPWPQPAPGMAV
jgi:cytochrome b pre-mRNA-processing protein 3